MPTPASVNLAESPEVRAGSPADGWQASLRLGFHNGSRRTELSERARFGPLSVQRPFYPEGAVCHVYLLHPPGGVVGGDKLDISVAVHADAKAFVTTPGAGKFYRSARDTARLGQSLRVGSGATLEWLPQENIFFPGTRTRIETWIDLQSTSRLAWWEVQCFGRPVIDEAFTEGAVDSCVEVRIDDRAVLIERLRVDPTTRRYSSTLADLPVSGTLMLYPCTGEHLETGRAAVVADNKRRLADDRVGLTLVDGILVARYLGTDTAVARRLLATVWTALRADVLGNAPTTPRIWLT